MLFQTPFRRPIFGWHLSFIIVPGEVYAVDISRRRYGKRGFNTGVYTEGSEPRPDLDMNRKRWFLHFGSARQVHTGEDPGVVHLRYPSREAYAAQSRAEMAQGLFNHYNREA